jgi:hypothetical protein
MVKKINTQKGDQTEKFSSYTRSGLTNSTGLGKCSLFSFPPLSVMFRIKRKLESYPEFVACHPFGAT